MAEKLFLADKKTLDEVKKDSNTIKENTQFLKEQFPISGGTDWSEYNHILSKRHSVIMKGENIELISIKSKGFLSAISFRLSSQNYTEKITTCIYIDGTKVVQKNGSGVVFLNKNMEPFLYNVSSTDVGKCKLQGIPYIENDSEQGTGIVSFMPLFFNKSLKITITINVEREMNFNYILGVKA